MCLALAIGRVLAQTALVAIRPQPSPHTVAYHCAVPLRALGTQSRVNGCSQPIHVGLPVQASTLFALLRNALPQPFSMFVTVVILSSLTALLLNSSTGSSP